MIIKGKYTTAEIFTENIEDAAIEWVQRQCDHKALEGVHIVQMCEDIVSHGVVEAAMESTAVYWVPVWNALC